MYIGPPERAQNDLFLGVLNSSFLSVFDQKWSKSGIFMKSMILRILGEILEIIKSGVEIMVLDHIWTPV